MKLFWYVSKHYFKNSLLFLFGITFATALTQFVQYAKRLDGFNRKLLYFFYSFEDFSNFVFPLALIFAAIYTLYSFVNKNNLVAIYALGYSKKALLKPFLAVFFLIYFIFIALNFTNFAYANNYANALLERGSSQNEVKDLFFKYNKSFVYAKELDVVKKEFDNLTLYHIKNIKLDYLLQAKKAFFSHNQWIAKDVVKKSIIYDKNGMPKGFRVEHLKKIAILSGYMPKVIKLLYQGKRMSLYDGLRALLLLKKQDIDNSKILSLLLNKTIMPLFVPIYLVFLVYLFPLHKRFIKPFILILSSIGVALIIWTLFYALNMLGITGVIAPSLGQPLLLALLLFSLFFFLKRPSF